MIPFLLANWRAAGFLVVLAGVFIGGWHFRGAMDEADKLKALTEQETSLTKQCNDSKAITENTSHALQDNVSSLHKQLVAAKLRYASTPCLSVTGTPPGRYDPDTGKLSGSNVGPAVSVANLLDFAGEADEVRLRLTACQTFINETWKANGQ